MNADAALLVLDVDGCLSPFTFDAPPKTWPDFEDWTDGPHHVPLSRQMADRLAALPARPVWCTTWQHQANEHLAPVLGWDPLPVLEPDPDEPWTHHTHRWKLQAVEQYVAMTRPPAVVWVDDDLAVDSDLAAAVAARGDQLLAGVPHLLVRPDRYIGLTPGDIDDIAAWLDLTR